MQYSTASTASVTLFLFSTLTISTPIAEPAPQNTETAGFTLFENSFECDPKSGSTSAPQSKVNYCFNLDNTAKSGAFQWPTDPSYQGIFYIAPDCASGKQEKQGNTTTFTYTPTGTLGDETVPTGPPENCYGPIWAQPGPGSVWLSPKSVVPPGGWPALPT